MVYIPPPPPPMNVRGRRVRHKRLRMGDTSYATVLAWRDNADRQQMGSYHLRFDGGGELWCEREDFALIPLPTPAANPPVDGSWLPKDIPTDCSYGETNWWSPTFKAPHYGFAVGVGASLLYLGCLLLGYI